MLIKGSKVDVKDSEGKTPLIIAAQKKYYDIVKLLLDKGADAEDLFLYQQENPDLSELYQKYKRPTYEEARDDVAPSYNPPTFQEAKDRVLPTYQESGS